MMKDVYISIWSPMVKVSTLAEVENKLDKELSISLIENMCLCERESYTNLWIDEQYIPRLHEILLEYSGFKMVCDEE